MKELIAALDEDPRNAIAGPSMVNLTGEEQVTAKKIPTGLLKDLMNKIGLLDEKIFYSPEDVEYCVRTWKAGFRVIYKPRARIIHATQRISKKKLISRHNWEHIKGLIYFFNKYGLFFSSESIIFPL